MPALYRYPFKSMISIVDELTLSKKSNSLYDLQRVTRACVPDTMEVTEMLSYLTSFGKIIETQEGWLRIYEKNPSKKPRRFFYLKEIVSLIKSISNSKALTPQQIADSIGMGLGEVVLYLQFLKKITSSGYIVIDAKGYPYNYYLETSTNVVK